MVTIVARPSSNRAVHVSSIWNGVIVTKTVAFAHARQHTEQLPSIVVVTGSVKLYAKRMDALMPNAGARTDGSETNARYQVNLYKKQSVCLFVIF